MENWRDYLVDKLKKDERDVSAYLNASMEAFEEDGNLHAFLLAVRTIVEVKGGFSKLSKQTGLNREHLYRLLSDKGNPTLYSLLKILNALGYPISFNPSKELKKAA